MTDRGQNFLSKLIGALCELFDVKHTKTSRYHPETNATVERANSTLAQTLRAYVSKDQQNWPSLLPSVMMAFRSTPCTESTGFSPFQLVFGREMNLPVDTSLVPKQTLAADTQQFMQQLLGNLKIFKELATEKLKTGQEKAKDRHDVRAKEPTFKVGDKVLLKKEKVLQGQSAKLSDKSEGPYEIVQDGPNFTYKIRNCQNRKVVKSFINARELKLYHERQPDVEEHPQIHQPLEMPQHGLPQPVVLPKPGLPQPVVLPQHGLPQPVVLPKPGLPPPVVLPKPGLPQPVDIPQPEPPPQANTEKTPLGPMAKPNPELADQKGQAPVPKDMSNVRIIQASRKGGRQRYRIEWPDGTRAWESENNVPKRAIHIYLKTHTKSGRKRKRKPKYFIQPKS